MATTKKKEAAVAAVLEAPTARLPQLVHLPTDQVKPWPGLNPRTHFDEQQLEELAASMRKSGVLEPILVHRRDGDDWSEGLIVAGERRWRAAVLAQIPTVPCLVREYSEAEALDIAIVENAQRSDLSSIEEARGFRKWLAGEGGRKVQDLADRIGKSQPYVSNRIRLLELPDEILQLIEEDLLPLGLARDLLLPFARIPEKPRAQLYAAVAKRIRSAVKADGEFTPQDLRRAVVEHALKLSRPITTRDVLYGRDPGPEFDAAQHSACTCNGPSFAYGWGSSTTVRCFDTAWWDAAQAEAKRRAEEEERKRAEKLKSAGAGGVVMTSDDFQKRHQHGTYESVRFSKDTSAYGRAELLDPAQLADARLVLVTDGYDSGLKCLDVDAVKKAKSAATRERNRLLAERRAARAERYRAEGAKVEVEPWMLGEILSARPQNDQILAIGREMGIDVGKHGELTGQLKKLPAEQVTLLFKVLALRHRAGELGWLDPLEKEVDAELIRKYSPGLRALEGQVKGAAVEPSAPKGRAGKAKKVPAAEVETPAQQLALRFQHLREATEAVAAAGGVAALASLGDAEGNPLPVLERRLQALKAYITEHGAVPIADASSQADLYYSIVDEQLLDQVEEMLEAAAELAHA